MPLKEKGQVERHTSKASLANAKDSAQKDEHGIRHGHSLQRGRDPPRRDNGRYVDVRRDQLPQQRHPLKGDVRHVKRRERPVVPPGPGRAGLQVLLHAGDARIANV